MEVFNVNNGILKFIQHNVNLENSQLARQLGVEEHAPSLERSKKVVPQRQEQKANSAMCGM